MKICPAIRGKKSGFLGARLEAQGGSVRGEKGKNRQTLDRQNWQEVRRAQGYITELSHHMETESAFGVGQGLGGVIGQYDSKGCEKGLTGPIHLTRDVGKLRNVGNEPQHHWIKYGDQTITDLNRLSLGW